MVTDKTIKKLEQVLKDIKEESLVVYGTSKHEVKEVDLGSGVSLEIHYFEDGEEINEAFFSANGGRLALSAAEIETLSLRF